MVSKNLNGIINKMDALNTYQSKQITKPCENEFINESCYHSHCISAQCFCFHPFGGIVSGYQNVFVPNIPIYGFDWDNKIQSPFHEGC
jgi:hypothetical protein